MIHVHVAVEKNTKNVVVEHRICAYSLIKYDNFKGFDQLLFSNWYFFIKKILTSGHFFDKVVLENEQWSFSRN